MKQWYPKEFSQLTQISVRTLHHYDYIGLLKPSVRQSNGYRLYSEADLLRLQQIIALKFFGFELAQIQNLLASQTSMREHFSKQAKCLQEKAEALMQASQLLQRFIANEHSMEESLPWENIIQLIEVYRMTQQLENSWAKEIFDVNELQQFAKFEASLKTTANHEKEARFQKQWRELMDEIKTKLDQDPTSKIGIQMGQRCMTIVNEFYGKENANLRTKIFEKGFGEGKLLEESHLTAEMVSWLEKAFDAYWRDRIYHILAQAGKISDSKLLSLWNELLDDMYGDEEMRKKELVQVVLADKQVSLTAKAWLKGI